MVRSLWRENILIMLKIIPLWLLRKIKFIEHGNIPIIQRIILF